MEDYVAEKCETFSLKHDGENSDIEAAKTERGNFSYDKQNSRTIMIFNLPFKARLKPLRKYLSEHLKVKRVFIVPGMMTKNKGLESEDEVKRALSLPEGELVFSFRPLKIYPFRRLTSSSCIPWKNEKKRDKSKEKDMSSCLDFNKLQLDNVHKSEPSLNSQVGVAAVVHNQCSAEICSKPEIKTCGKFDSNNTCTHLTTVDNLLKEFPNGAGRQPSDLKNLPIHPHCFSGSEWPDGIQQDANCHYSLVHITNLNEHCLLEIFSHFNLFELLRLQKVCHQWNRLVKKIMKKIKALMLTEFHYWNKLYDHQIRAILLQCGEEIETIEFPLFEQGLTYLSLKSVGKYCPNLKKLHLGRIFLAKTAVKYIVSKLDKIEFLDASQCLGLNQAILWQMLKDWRNLEYLDISEQLINGKCFFQLGPKMKILKLNKCFKLKSAAFEFLEKRCPDLEELLLDQVPSQNVCMTSISKLHKLKVLIMSNMGLKLLDMYKLHNLKYLVKLSLRGSHTMNDNFIVSLPDCCPHIEYLDVGNCDYNEITDNGMSALAQLQHLQHLDVSYNYMITDEGIIMIAKKGSLTYLDLKAMKVTDKSMPELALNCPKLQYLNLSGCLSITNATVTAFNTFFCSSLSDMVLELYLERSIFIGEMMKGEILKSGIPSVKICLVNLISSSRNDLDPNNYVFDDESDDENFVEEDQALSPSLIEELNQLKEQAANELKMTIEQCKQVKPEDRFPKINILDDDTELW